MENIYSIFKDKLLLLGEHIQDGAIMERTMQETVKQTTQEKVHAGRRSTDLQWSTAPRLRIYGKEGSIVRCVGWHIRCTANLSNCDLGIIC
jgi:hypothetical protein